MRSSREQKNTTMVTQARSEKKNPFPCRSCQSHQLLALPTTYTYLHVFYATVLSESKSGASSHVVGEDAVSIRSRYDRGADHQNHLLTKSFALQLRIAASRLLVLQLGRLLLRFIRIIKARVHSILLPLSLTPFPCRYGILLACARPNHRN